MAKLEKNNSQKKDLNQLKDVSGGAGDIITTVEMTSKVKTHKEDNSKTASISGGIGGNFSM